ncbi:glycosyltransferase [Vibrio splendidus]
MKNENIGVAVAMSVYHADRKANIELSINSLLTQTYEFVDIYVQVDGPVDPDISELLLKYERENIERFSVEFNSDNLGLATRLNSIIDTVVNKDKYKYLARMDADDISMSDRIDKQVSFMENNVDISVLGTSIVEIDHVGNVVFEKRMSTSHSELQKNIIKSCPFNHPTVMFRLDVFFDGFRYNSKLKNTQDYYLWVDLLEAGKRFANIEEPLLKFRVDSNFHHRRGVIKALNDVKSRLYAFKKLKIVNVSNLAHVIALFCLRISPSFIKKWAYKNLR